MFQRRQAGSAPPVLDTDHLDRLEGHLGPDALSELLADGLIELSDRLNRLGQLQKTAELDSMGRLGHDLAGMAGNLGLTRLAATAREMNRVARAGDKPAALAEAGAVRRLGFEASEALRHHLAYLRSA